MKREEAKAEAEKIIQEIAKIVGSNCEHDSYCHEAECNRIKGITFCKVDYETAKKLAILQVKGRLSVIDLFSNDMTKMIVKELWQSILTEIENK